MVEKNADIEDNFQVVRELEELMGGGGSAWADLGLRLVKKEEEDDGRINPIAMKKMVTGRRGSPGKSIGMRKMMVIVIVRRGIPRKMGIGGTSSVIAAMLGEAFAQESAFMKSCMDTNLKKYHLVKLISDQADIEQSFLHSVVKQIAELLYCIQPLHIVQRQNCFIYKS